MRTSFLCVGLVIGGLTAGPSWARGGANASIHQDIHQLKKDYQRKMDKELKRISAKIQKLEHQATKAKAQTKVNIDKEVKKLKVKKADVDRRFDEIGRSAGDAWKDLQKGLDDAVSDLKKAVDGATERFQERK